MGPNKRLLDKFYCLWEKYPEDNFFSLLFKHTHWGFLDTTPADWDPDEDKLLENIIDRQLINHEHIDLNL